MNRMGIRPGTKLLLLWLLASSFAWASQQAGKPNLPANPQDLVRRTIANELKPSQDKTLYEFRVTKKLPQRTETKQMVETTDATLGRLVLINGKPLTAEQRAKEDARLQRLTNDASEMAKKKKEQADDDRRTREMVQALPDAFLYQYAGTENKEPWGEIAVLKFKPNPNFDPPNHETLVYRGMEGEMWVAIPEYRLAKIEARLFKEVQFGWGIIGHLDQGGQFIVEQKPVNSGHWEPSHMVLNFTGKVLLFKTLNIQQDETTSDYKPVPQMTVAQALDFLKKEEIQVAQSGGK